MTPSIVSTDVDWIAREIGPDPDDRLRAMDERASQEDFPHVGPAVGGWMALLARLVDARRIFEFGSGFGYSAYWTARELPPDGEVVLTEIDEDELALAREYFEAAGFADVAQFEHGDALDVIERYDGPFDLVLIDHQKERYVAAFEAVREKVPPGGLILADNALEGPVDPATIRGLLAGDVEEASSHNRGIASYLAHVRDADGYRTGLLPLGEGVAVTRKE